MSAVIDLEALGELPELTRRLLAEVQQLRAEVQQLRAERGDELLTVVAAAELIGTTPGALRAKIKRGTLVVVRRGGSVFLRRADVVGKVSR